MEIFRWQRLGIGVAYLHYFFEFLLWNNNDPLDPFLTFKPQDFPLVETPDGLFFDLIKELAVFSASLSQVQYHCVGDSPASRPCFVRAIRSIAVAK